MVVVVGITGAVRSRDEQPAANNASTATTRRTPTTNRTPTKAALAPGRRTCRTTVTSRVVPANVRKSYNGGTRSGSISSLDKRANEWAKQTLNDPN